MLTSAQTSDPLIVYRTEQVLKERLKHLPEGAKATIRFGKKGVIVLEAEPNIDLDQYEQGLTGNPRLEFYDAKTVQTGKGVLKLYEVGEQSKYRGAPAFSFYKQDRSAVKPDTPEYKQMIASWGKPVLEAGDLYKVLANPRGNSYVPYLMFSSEGSKKIEAWSRRNMNRGAQLAAVMDGVVISIAPLRDGTILRDEAVIEGEFDKDYVLKLQEMLNAGALPVPLKVESVEKR